MPCLAGVSTLLVGSIERRHSRAVVATDPTSNQTWVAAALTKVVGGHRCAIPLITLSWEWVGKAELSYVLLCVEVCNVQCFHVWKIFN